MTFLEIMQRISNYFFSFSDKKKDLDNKLTEKDNAIKMINTQKVELQNLMFERDAELKNLNSKINELVNKNIYLDSTLKEYRIRFGTLDVLKTTNIEEILPTDADANIFNQLVKLNGGNPFSWDQIKAIRFDMHNHLRIIAGAGSGKTQTICAKAAYLVLKENVKESSIMMCTFSRKAKLEMQDRVIEYLQGNNKISVQTFHGWFLAEYNLLIKDYPHLTAVGIPGTIDEVKYKNIIRNLIKKYNLYNFDKHEDKTIIERLSYWLNMGFEDKDIIAFIKKHFDDSDFLTNKHLSEIFTNFLQDLNKQKRDDGVITFDDMLCNLKLVLQNDNQALKDTQNRYKYIFIDEFQDINPLQKQIVELICPPDKEQKFANECKLIIVGDDDQSIYYFRGAEPKYIKEFDQQYQQTSIELMKNYRSDAPIVQAGNTLIVNNSHDRLEKSMIPNRKIMHNDCYIKGFDSEEEEADWITSKAIELAVKEKPFQDNFNEPNYTETLVLYPTRLQLRSLIRSLEKKAIPFVTKPDDDLLGIFGLPFFKQYFKLLIEISEAKNRDTQLIIYKRLIQNFCSYYYIPFAASTTFTENNSSCTAENIALFISNKKTIKEKEKKDIKLFFGEIMSFIKTNELNLTIFVRCLISTPKFVKELSEEERTWLERELNSAKKWNVLLKQYEKSVILKTTMKKKLKEYDENKYNALYLLTIHASKGLGKKNVFVKGVYNNSLPDYRAQKKCTFDVDSLVEQASPPTTIEEQRRLMYVAITRAKENLYITYPRMVNNKPTIMSPFVKESNIKIV
ncbi:TPA: ATP-dependent helicase [Enterococcus faecalis]|nr:ATP-dependent helicase [Enterococcus faecalis]HBI1786091.1 ATP-dependent helicase [Enterococcus faecalis]HBI1791366.1 ATP-dependent helicase [Enterococcus faecalis]HBI1887133.1 ATP-dependent helicase [Enterococcus faecalis]HBI1897171.1 ATP-dependent helicase [Enterococcus faecalis]